MTWAQFKAFVDAQLKEKGISEDTEIWYIDISFPCAEHEGTAPSVEEGYTGISIS